ncbi:hypothetical protein [Massilia sp. YIM B04103]|uniref:hypothetical protein n=1 Tax=Massilia sp. YIM B04103 TaxID=2963106 RepID=UPI00210C25AB|nr:hypothetical protein [Massilia sp. YIM B04103]
MEHIAELEDEYFQLRFFYSKDDSCVDWAVERLRHDQEGDDLEVILLASARGRDEILPLVEIIVDRYRGPERLDDQSLAGKYIVKLRQIYLQGQETIHSLDEKFTQLYSKLGYPNWLVMLSRNCEYATDVPAFVQPFEDEFEYISSLWDASRNLAEFEAQYSRKISDQHDINYN